MPAFNKTSIEIIDIPDIERIKEGAPLALDPMSLSHRLGIRNRTLMHMVINRQKMYDLHFIKKKSGGIRMIHAPQKMLKYVQKRVLDRVLNTVEYPDHITAYVKERTTRHGAAQHAGKPLLIVIDIKDFFTSTRRSWVRRALQDEFGYSHRVASVLSDVMTVPFEFKFGKRYIVPQGAPTSGAMCNWVAHHRFDKKILELCEEHGYTYTRYADDLAFSHKKKLPRRKVNAFIREINKILQDAGYRSNRKKTRVQRRGRQQRLLGMTINEKPNVMRQQYRKLRARIHHIHHKGFNAVAGEMGLDSGEQLRSQIEGMISYYKMINPQKATKLQLQLDDAVDHLKA